MKYRDRIKELIRVPASELLANPLNFREHSDTQRAVMEGILGEIGYIDGLIAFRNKKKQLIVINGHLRRDISGDETVPVLVVDLTEAEAKKALATFDPVGALATTNSEALAKLRADLGVQSEAVNKMLAELAAQVVTPPAAVVEDDIPPVQKKAKTRKGDLYILGEHRLLCGDSTQAADVGRLMGKELAALVATDPPYGVDFAGAKYCPTAKKWDGIANDKRQGSDLRSWLGDMWKLWLSKAVREAAFYSWAAAMEEGSAAAAAMRDAGIHVQGQIIWVKNALILGQSDYQWKHENCWYGFLKGQRHRWYGGRAQTTVWEVKKVTNSEYVHPMQKPVELYAIPIGNHTTLGEVVAEPFSGSGTQIIAAEQLGRRCYAMEIDPLYCDVAVERWEKFTGKKAKLERAAAARKP